MQEKLKYDKDDLRKFLKHVKSTQNYVFFALNGPHQWMHSIFENDNTEHPIHWMEGQMQNLQNLIFFKESNKDLSLELFCIELDIYDDTNKTWSLSDSWIDDILSETKNDSFDCIYDYNVKLTKRSKNATVHM